MENKHIFSWAEVYVEPGRFAKVIRNGMLLVNPTPHELWNYMEQSKVNFAVDGTYKPRVAEGE